jgi:RNA polymerase sigma factor (sigma-70 family)
MRLAGSGGTGVREVVAAQQGDRQALDDLLAGYLPLIYNIVGRALNGHADVDDVVQETMLRAVRNVADLRDPAAFRSWLVAVAVRQVRDYHRARPAIPGGDLASEVADPEADFVGLTILRLGLSGQRQETAEATRWLDPGDRDLLALWWLEAAGELDRGEVAAALGLPSQHAAVRVARMKQQLTTARVLVHALHAAPPCPGLRTVADGWDGRPSPLWRKRIGRHVRDCPHCASYQHNLIPAERLLAGLTLVPVPAAAAAGAAARPGRPGRPPSGHRGSAARQAARSGHRGIVSHAAGMSVPSKVLAAAIAVSCAAAGGYAVLRGRHQAPPPGPAPTAAALARPDVHLAPSPPPASTAPPVRQPAANAKKGVSTWSVTGASAALAASGASWYYTWGASPPGISSPRRVRFVPMIWGAANVTPATLAEVSHEGRYLLGFNEPDLSSQSNMPVSQALSLWPQLMSTGMRLGSPAVAAGGATPGGWLDQFMQGAAARGYRVNFITLHWYGSDFATGPAVSQLQSYLQAVHARYHKPIWLTEFALASFAAGPSFPSPGQQAAFLTAATAMLQRLPYVQRYAWFALPATSGDGSAGLFGANGQPTTAGRAFEAVDARR